MLIKHSILQTDSIENVFSIVPTLSDFFVSHQPGTSKAKKGYFRHLQGSLLSHLYYSGVGKPKKTPPTKTTTPKTAPPPPTGGRWGFPF